MTTSIFTSMTENSYREIDITVVDSDGVLIDLTDVDLIKWAISSTENDSILIQKSYPASGILLTNASAGLITIVISGVDTSGLGGGTYFQQSNYDLNGQRVPIVKGTMKIYPTII